MQGIVTTFKSVLLINFNNDKITTLHEGSGVYYGVTWNKETLFVAARYGYKDELGQTERVMMFGRGLRFKGFLKCADSANAGFHAMQYDPKTNYLWITAPNQNKVIVINLATRERHDVYPNKARVGTNWNHFNSVTIDGDKMMVNAHNGISAIPHGQIYFCDREKLTTSYVIDMRRSVQSHNCFMFNGELHTCSSNTGQITNYAGVSLRQGRIRGYVRGISITEKFLLVGESARAAREDRVNADGFIHVYDRWNLKHLRTISFPNCGQILAIRILNQKDHHHQVAPFL